MDIIPGTWVRPALRQPEMGTPRRRPNRVHLVYEVNSDGTWVAHCDALARQLARLLPGPEDAGAGDKCLKCQRANNST